MLQVGSMAPEFELADQHGEARTLAALLVRGPLVLYFYPADFTPVCTAEACMFRDVHTEIAEAGLSVAGISPQSSASHQKFGGRHKLPFPLLADTDKSVVRAYEANGPFGIGVRRLTYLIAPDRTITDAVRSDLGIGRHRKFVRAAIEARSGS